MKEFSAKCHLLSEMIAYRLDDVLVKLEVDLKPSGKMLQGPCPLHGGRNPAGFVLYTSGHSLIANHRCFTKGCSQVFLPSALGFIRGRLSHLKLGYNGVDKKDIISFNEAKEWACTFLKVNWHSLRPDLVQIEKSRFISNISKLSKTPLELPETGWPRALLETRLTIPSPYFVSRGFSAELLSKYSIGDAKYPSPNEQANRAVIPIMDKTSTRVLGVTGRSLYQGCQKCGVYHDNSTTCPIGLDASLPSYAKWRNTKDFRIDNHLFSLNSAANFIKKEREIILVEGPLDVLKLEEAGICNSVAVFGVGLTDKQQVLLETSAAMCVLVAFDNDEAGQNGSRIVLDKLQKLFRIKAVVPPRHDWGECSVSEIHEVFGRRG